MNSDKNFKSNIRELTAFATNISNNLIKEEPMLFNSDLDFSYKNGGIITRSFIDSLPEDWKISKTVFDSRVHMLMPGWYPAIPGWHHDDVPRSKIPTGQHFIAAGQPDYDNPRYLSEHIFGLVNADICPTEFALGECIMSKIPNGELIYRKWHQEVEKLLLNEKLQRFKSRDRTLYYFDWQSFHSGTKAISNGWRWFGRISRNTDRALTITNEMRKQVQIYLEFPMEGW